MSRPSRKSEHVWTCALCGESKVCGTMHEQNDTANKHLGEVHKKYSHYQGDAANSVLVLFEADKGDFDQPSSHTDPTEQFLKYVSWRATRDE